MEYLVNHLRELIFSCPLGLTRTYWDSLLIRFNRYHVVLNVGNLNCSEPLDMQACSAVMYISERPTVLSAFPSSCAISCDL